MDTGQSQRWLCTDGREEVDTGQLKSWRDGGGQRRKARGGRQKTKKQEKEGRVYVRNSRKERA